MASTSTSSNELHLYVSSDTKAAQPPKSELIKNKQQQQQQRILSSQKYRCFSPTRATVLRATLIVSLLAAAGACAGLSYVILSNSEQEVGRQTYESIAASALDGAQATTLRKLQGSEVMAALLSYTAPDADMWPLITMDGYIPIADKVAKLSSSNTQSLMVFVDPQNVTEYTKHVQQEFITQGRPETAGVSDFGFGIYKSESTESPFEDGRLPDVTGETNWGGTLGLLAPLTFHNSPGASSLLFNVYSKENRGIHLDSMVACTNANANANSTGTVSPSCAVITDMLVLQVRPGPAGLLFQPVFPANDPTRLVGFATTSIHWQEVLTSVVPSYVNGLTCVVSTDTSSFTYEIRDGVPELVGPGDLHLPEFTSFARSVVLNDFIETGSATSATYTLTVYPTEVMFDTFTTNSPIAVAFGFFGVIALCTLLFFAYDFLMRHEAQQRQVVLEMKRLFVRFISHEIRTPLNTVCMGLELLESELRGSSENHHGDDNKVTAEDVAFWHNVAIDAKENSNVAVSILDDLLEYDKLETGMMKLELSTVSMWDLVAKTANQFNIQAVNRKIDLVLNAEKPNSSPVNSSDLEATTAVERELIVMGDDVKLGQVMRNVISNALKFTSVDGTIEVTVSHITNGLPGAMPLTTNGDTDTLVEPCIHPRAGSVRICTTDSGVGLSQEQLGQLFTEGVQFDANKLQHGGGSGLGLAIAKGIVDQHGGTIYAVSKGHGHGTSFVFELPLYEFPADQVKQPGENDAGSTIALTEASDGPSPMLQSLRVLVAEDSASSLKMLIRLLERGGHTCVGVENGREAVKAFELDLNETKQNPSHAPFDTFLCDFEMPILRGPAATREIRQLGFTGTIVGVTGNVLAEDIKFFKEHGADEVLAKPISMDRLTACWESTGMKGKTPLQ